MNTKSQDDWTEYNLAKLDKLNQKIESDPTHILSYLRRADVKLELENVEGATADLDKVIELDPKNVRISNYRKSINKARKKLRKNKGE